MKSHEFHPQARSEFADAIRLYESERAGWGGKLHDAVFHAIARICVFPECGSMTRLKTRKVVVHGFPYVLHYELVHDKIVLWAVMHGARHPEYWITRRKVQS